MPETKKEIYTKSPKTFTEQVDLLESRGLNIENKHKAEKILTYISYNRLSNYWYPLLKEPKEEEQFKEGSTFETIFKLYQFDSDLRTLTFQAIEQIEIAIRTQTIYHLSHDYKTGFWYESSDSFKDYPNYVQFLTKITKNVQETKQEYILKYHRNYVQYMPPSWKAFELLTFTNLLSVLKNVKNYKQIIPIAQSIGLHHSILISWLECLVYIRNICAHHGRLWNIILTISPEWIKSPKRPWVDRWENNISTRADSKDKVLKIYAGFCIIVYCLGFVNPYNKYASSLIELFNKYPQVDLNHMGFPENWKEQPLWTKYGQSKSQKKLEAAAKKAMKDSQ
ncbi:Abi family protein [Poritiphilus flavus]|uniref:Abortive infection bacteriophage resistance protein n=1 Tax=Poritiphilus flavus TaxID=2697053 RepID=A0A6L9E859_9FLAO|nr:Abi family protein [Poritiphilus flavus]NAS10649.1 hypothetical protein [Poritiphilus flavus]